MLILVIIFISDKPFLPEWQNKFSICPITFQSFFGFGVTIITLSECSRRVNFAEDLMNSLGFFIRNDLHDAINETQSLSFTHSLFIGLPFLLGLFVHSAVTSE